MVMDSASGNNIKVNKYKILRMSLLLGQDDNREETINNFEDASREIDAMNDEVYLREIESKFYDTLTLEEEEKKLAALVDYIGGRVDQRISLLQDFANVTGFELTNLSPIKYEDRLEEFKDRLRYIREYLDNIKNIEELNKEVLELENKLERTYQNKEKAEEKNKNDEKILLDKFKNILNKNLEFKDLDVDNIDTILDEVVSRSNESKKSLDIFNKSFSTLEDAGISYEEEQEYLSYVNSARDSYYKNKEQEYLLNIYKLLLNDEIEYGRLLYKREAINNILYERINLRKDLGVKESDSLSDIYDLLDRQYKNIKAQKTDIDNIDILSQEINTKRDTVKELELDNQKVEILSLLKEFCIIDTYDEFENPSFNHSDSALDNGDLNSIGNLNFDKNDAMINQNSSVDNMFGDNTNVTSGNLTNSSFDVLGTNEDMHDSFLGGVDNSSSYSQGGANTNLSFELPSEDLKEEIRENQVVDVQDAKRINLEVVIEKANSVMKRVGKMLGVEVGENEKIVSVENNPAIESNSSNTTTLDSQMADVPTGESLPDNNLFFTNDLSNNIDNSVVGGQNNSNFEVSNSDLELPGNDFWGETFDDGGLSSLPDLPVSGEVNSNNFFVNNEIPNFNFDFGSNNGEVQ